ncbi:type II toxin-antitoxin system VapC family toxin [Candidatus Bathyarchaeota archaeon]|nr:type II toxin-antitoxin system VapC family toxin [Candidatus Bathyarchaeota archaeon]
MRIIDSDILSYALYNESPAHPYAWGVLERGLLGELEIHLTYTTILEAYNVLFWFYGVRPMERLLEKLMLTTSGLKILETSIMGLNISLEDNIPLGDGFLIATALKHRIPIIVSNDSHIMSKAPKHGLIVENPIPGDVRKKLAEKIPETS